jgi:hypothetical protein
MLLKDIIRGYDLGQLIHPKSTAHISDRLRYIFLIRKKIVTLQDARPSDFVGTDLVLEEPCKLLKINGERGRNRTFNLLIKSSQGSEDRNISSHRRINDLPTT